MTVKELIELNQMITDIEITVRKDGTTLFDQLNIGISKGIKPPYPTMVPKDERYIGNLSMASKREAHYIDKSINAWDDGKDYWQVKYKRIPKKWLDLEVYAWEVWPASTVMYAKNRRNDYGNTYKNINFHGQGMIHRYIIEATDEVKGFEEAIERLDREWGIEELEPCDDAISRQAVLDYIGRLLNQGTGKKKSFEFIQKYVKELPPVTPQPYKAESEEEK